MAMVQSKDLPQLRPAMLVLPASLIMLLSQAMPHLARLSPELTLDPNPGEPGYKGGIKARPVSNQHLQTPSQA